MQSRRGTGTQDEMLPRALSWRHLRNPMDQIDQERKVFWCSHVLVYRYLLPFTLSKALYVHRVRNIRKLPA